jgi:nucleotide-binding universal stress UspA family protein
MFKGVETILFTTNLTRNCVPAFDVATILGLKFHAKIIILHVIEKIPNYIEGRLEGLLGKDHYKEMLESFENEIRQKLIGKRSTGKLIRKALERFCLEAGLDDKSCGYQTNEVIICEGNVVDCILETAQKHGCDMIIMGGHEAAFMKTAVGTTIKSVLGKSKIPVLVVPADPKEIADLPEVLR